MLTRYMFVTGLYFVADVLQHCGAMSLGFRPRDTCTSLQQRTVDQCWQRLDKFALFQGDQWQFFEEHFQYSEEGSGFLGGVPLHECNKQSAFKAQATEFVTG